MFNEISYINNVPLAMPSLVQLKSIRVGIDQLPGTQLRPLPCLKGRSGRPQNNAFCNQPKQGAPFGFLGIFFRIP